MLDGCVDGTPPLAEHGQYKRWVESARASTTCCAAVLEGKGYVSGCYGGTNPGNSSR